MKLRPELCPHEIDQATRTELAAMVREIEHALELDPPRAEALIASFNQRTGHEYVAHDFAHYDAAMDLEEFIADATHPAKVHDITREELEEIISRFAPSEEQLEELMRSGGASAAKSALKDASFYMNLFDAQFDMPAASNLFFYPPEDWEGTEWHPTPALVIEIASSYTVDALGPSSVLEPNGGKLNCD